MKILVLGGCGFIGSHIVDGLLADGHDVRVFGRSAEKARSPLPAVDYRLGDFTDAGRLADSLQDIDIVIHAISSTTPAISNDDPQADIRDNLINTLTLLDLMRRHSLRRIVFLSSGGTVYGNPNILPIPEDAPLHPICSYGVVKVAIEHYLFMYQHLYDIQPVIIRPSNPYGPRHGQAGLQGVITSYLGNLLHGKALTVWGDGSVVRDFIDVRDVARLCVIAASHRATGVFNAGSGEGHSIREVIDSIAAVTGINPECDFREGRNFDVQKVVLDIRKSQSAFGWTPRIPFEQGIREYWSWLQKTGGAHSRRMENA